MFDGKKLKAKRKELRLSAEKLAVILKVNPGNIYKWEKGIQPSDPQEYMRLEAWLKGFAPMAEDENDFQKKYIALLERTNLLLEATIKKLVQ